MASKLKDSNLTSSYPFCRLIWATCRAIARVFCTRSHSAKNSSTEDSASPETNETTDDLGSYETKEFGLRPGPETAELRCREEDNAMGGGDFNLTSVTT